MANEAKKVSLNPALLEYERIQNERLMIQKWNGTVPQTVTVVGNNASPNIMLGIK